MKHPANFGEYTPRNNAESHRRDPSHPARHHRRPAALLLRLGRRQSPDPHVPLLPPRPRRHRPRHPRDHPPAPTRTRSPPRHPRRRLTTQDEAGRPTRRHGHLRRGGCALLRWWSRGRSHRLADRVWTRRALPSASRWDRPPTEVRPLLTWSARIRERSRRRSTVFRISRAAAGSPRGEIAGHLAVRAAEELVSGAALPIGFVQHSMPSPHCRQVPSQYRPRYRAPPLRPGAAAQAAFTLGGTLADARGERPHPPRLCCRGPPPPLRAALSPVCQEAPWTPRASLVAASGCRSTAAWRAEPGCFEA